ncbi:MAG: VWA domain-containing protein, partial [Gammaproteobacteria bacterium]|nr:VWA domain-containing protein [Gammaproteobacteria bacterium]
MIKTVIGEFLEQRRGDRAGLIVFADDAFTVAPISSDLNLIRTLLFQMKNGIAGERTALGDAIALAVKRLQDRQHPARVVILFSDGSNTAGSMSPEDALLLAQESGIKIYTVAIGSNRTVAFPRGANNSPEFTRLPVDEALLRRLAVESGGRYYHAADSSTMMQIIADIDQLETIEQREQNLFLRQAWYWLPLLVGLSLLLVARQRCGDSASVFVEK